MVLRPASTRSSLALILLLLCHGSAADAASKDVEQFFARCEKAAKGGDATELQEQLDAARREVRGDYRYLYYRAVLLYARGEIAAAQTVRQAVIASLEADQVSPKTIQTIDERFSKFHEQALKNAKVQYVDLVDTDLVAAPQTGNIVTVHRFDASGRS